MFHHSVPLLLLVATVAFARTQAKPFGYARTKTLDQCIRALHEIQYQVHRVGFFEIQRDRVPVAQQGIPRGRH